MDILQNNLEKIQQLCKQNKVKHLFVFGSVLTDKFNQKSDIDLLVDFDENNPFLYTDLYFNFKQELEQLFQREVDLVEERAIRNVLLKEEITKNRVKLYG